MRETRPSVLFVDRDPAARAQLAGALRNLVDWDLRFAETGEIALKLLLEGSYEAVVTDVQLPGMSGSELLGIIRLRWPNMIRLVLSGETDQAELLSGVASIHQFLQKPCTAEALVWSIGRSLDLARGIRDVGLQKVVNRIESLPVLSTTYTRLVQALADDACDVDQIATIASEDVGLSTKCLQMVNSAFFGLSRRVTSVKDAISLIGLQRLRVLAIASRVVDAVSGDEQEEQIARLWKTSCDVGGAAAVAARQAGQSRLVMEDARLAGTLALIGRALLLRFQPEQYEQVLEQARSSGCTLSQAEEQIFGVPQHYVGAYALGIWAFDDAIVDAVANQMHPPLESDSGLQRYVHLARTIDYGETLVDCFDASDRLQEAVAALSAAR